MLLEIKSADPINGSAPSPSTISQPIKRPARRYRPRRTTADRVRDALLTLAEGRAQLLSHEEKPWASITFAGSRHEIMFDFDGSEAVDVGEEFIAALPDHEFKIPGQLVADANVVEASHSFTPEPRLVVTLVLLLLDDA
ncbi:MAG: hypothetical protein ABJP48_08455 [Erythrobacter sp.]